MNKTRMANPVPILSQKSPAMRPLAWVLLLILCTTLHSVASDFSRSNSNQFETANQQYAQGNWTAALTAYESLAKTGPVSANLFLNLGNTHFQLGNFGSAALFFERALQLDPNHPEARFNLRATLEKAGTPVQPEFWVINAIRHVAPRAPHSLWPVLGSIFFWMLTFCTLAMRWGYVKSVARLSLPFAALGLIFSSGVFLIQRSEHRRAVVVVPQTAALAAPADRSSVTLTLTAGAPVEPLAVRGPWTYCALPENIKGWLPTSHIQALYPAP